MGKKETNPELTKKATKLEIMANISIDMICMYLATTVTRRPSSG